jgi:uncharacterized membrane protein
MSTIERSIDVHAPVATVYNQWTQFEEFPRFMEGVESVTQLDERRLHWIVNLGGQRREWDAEITEQRPDERIAWTARTGTPNAGVVTFHRLSDVDTRVMVQLEVYPEGPLEKVADALGSIDRGVKGDLHRFKDFIESRGQETGAWRGQIEPPERRAG